MWSSRALVASALSATLVFTACAGSDADSTETSVSAPAAETDAASVDAASVDESGVRVVSAAQAAATIESATPDLVILDIRTPEEFDEVRLDGAVLLDFYRTDFAEQLAALDPDVPYVLYCRSGNRSSEARALMTELGFASVEDVDGGIVSWVDAGLPVTSG